MCSHFYLGEDSGKVMFTYVILILVLYLKHQTSLVRDMTDYPYTNIVSSKIKACVILLKHA